MIAQAVAVAAAGVAGVVVGVVAAVVAAVVGGAVVDAKGRQRLKASRLRGQCLVVLQQWHGIYLSTCSLLSGCYMTVSVMREVSPG